MPLLRFESGNDAHAVPGVDGDDGHCPAHDFSVAVVLLHFCDDCITDATWKQGCRFGEAQYSAFLGGKERRGVVPDRQPEELARGDAHFEGIGAVKVSAEGAAVELAGTCFDEFQEWGWKPQGVDVVI